MAFPIIYKIMYFNFPDNWQITLSFFQIIFHSLITALIFSLFKNYKLNNGTSFIFALIIGLNPNLQVYTTYVLADLMLGNNYDLIMVFYFKNQR